MKTNYRFYIGIDTGVNTGLCIWSKPNKKIHWLDAYKIHEAMDVVKDWVKNYPGDVFIRVEDARLRKWIPREKNAKDEAGRREGAGSVKRDAIIWEDFLKSIRAEFEMVAPKNNKTKMKAEYFGKVTGWTEQTNEHTRDAAMLVFGF